MSVDLIFQIVLNVPRHEDNGLSHEKKKNPSQKRQAKYNTAKKQ